MADFLAQYISPPWIAYTLWALVQVAMLLAVVMLSVAFFTWLERKESGRIQDRLGPTRVGGRFGWLQPVADGLKLVMKEDLIPRDADRLLFRAAPYIDFCAAFAVFAAVPVASGWVALQLDSGVFLIFAVSALEVLGVILAGYASGSKWSLFGSMREAAQAVSYEIPLLLAAVVPVMIAGTLDPVKIGDRQAGWFFNWYIFHDPLAFLTFWVYFTCAVAKVNRAPFDLAEAESELVAGFMTEYSGFRWAVFFMAEYASMLAVSFLAAILFFGGWNGPLPIAQWLGLTADHGAVAGYLGNLLGAVNFLAKGFFGVAVMIWARWTLPRLRIDQVMTVCLKYCIPLAAGMFLGATVWMYVFPAGVMAWFSDSPSAPRAPRKDAASAPAGLAPAERRIEGTSTASLFDLAPPGLAPGEQRIGTGTTVPIPRSAGTSPAGAKECPVLSASPPNRSLRGGKPGGGDVLLTLRVRPGASRTPENRCSEHAMVRFTHPTLASHREGAAS